MIPNSKDRNVQSSGVSEQATFGISADDTAHIMGILRDTLYTDRVLAVLREYGANAWDANREAGRGDTPLKIHVPTNADPTLTIRDFGPGLSDAEVFTVYTQYGKSTKRGSDLAVGMLGIGSKSAFAYSDTFTITSWHGGMKRVYVAALDDSDLGVMQRLHEEPCDESETGVEVKVAVRPEDLWEFERKARNLYSYYTPRPEINVTLAPEKEAAAVLPSGVVHEDDGEWLALMGCVPYRINIEQLRGSDEAEGLWLPLNRMSGVLKFDIGEVEISASREELKYSKRTKEILLSRFEKLFEEYVEHSLKMLKDDKVLSWAKRLRLHGMGKLGLPFPDSAKEWVAENVRLYDKIKKGTKVPFTILRGSSAVGQVMVNSDTRIVIRNDKKKIKGYRLGQYDYVVNPNPGESMQAVRDFLAKLLKKAGMVGIEVVDISTLPYSVVQANNGRTPNKKHRVRSFRLVGTSTYGSRSRNWEIVDREPTDDDVFVIISRFEAVDFGDFYRAYEQDKYLADALGLEMPEVYGYKTTSKKPVTDKDCDGMNYRVWRDKFFEGKMTPLLWRYMSYNEWANLLRTSWTSGYHNPWKGKTQAAKAEAVKEHLVKLLGEDHPIVKLFERHLRGIKTMNKCPRKIRDIMGTLRQRFGGPKHPTAGPALKRIRDRYPLFTRHASVEALWEPDSRYADKPTWVEANEWAEYIKMVDTREAKKNAGGLTSALDRVG